MELCEQVLNLARWAPSGDNTQPWRFELLSDHEILVHGFDTRAHCVYDLDGWASQLAHGALLENITLAATRFGRRAHISVVSEYPDGRADYRVVLEPDASVTEDGRVACMRERVVQRRPMRTAPLSARARAALERSAAPYSVIWLDSWTSRWRMALLCARNAHIRLTIPEAYAVHKAVIAWNSKTSEDRLPDASLGANAMLLGIMRWAMANWGRVHFMNRYAGGTMMPRLLMDFAPGLLCSAHFALVASREPLETSDRLDAGRAVQRFWLSATALGLQIQPAYTPLVFARYARAGILFTKVEKAQATAAEIARRLDDLLGPAQALRTIFMGRIGPARPVKGRSIRLPLERLIVREAPKSL